MTDTPKERDMGLKVALPTPPSRPWTQGPWWSETREFGSNIVNDGAGSQIAECRPAMYASAVGDTALIALAPEMAEAILAVQDLMDGEAHHDGDHTWEYYEFTVEQLQALYDVAYKLHEIGNAS